MHIVKINQGRADLCDSKFGSFIRTLASGGVIDADINDDGIVLITFDDGSVRIMREDKSFIRTIRSMSNSVKLCLQDGMATTLPCVWQMEERNCEEWEEDLSVDSNQL